MRVVNHFVPNSNKKVKGRMQNFFHVTIQFLINILMDYERLSFSTLIFVAGFLPVQRSIKKYENR